MELPCVLHVRSKGMLAVPSVRESARLGHGELSIVSSESDSQLQCYWPRWWSGKGQRQGQEQIQWQRKWTSFAARPGLGSILPLLCVLSCLCSFGAFYRGSWCQRWGEERTLSVEVQPLKGRPDGKGRGSEERRYVRCSVGSRAPPVFGRGAELSYGPSGPFETSSLLR